MSGSTRSFGTSTTCIQRDHSRLEPVRRKMDAASGTIDEAHVDLAEVELGKLAGHALEAHCEFGGDLLPGLGEHPVGCREPERCARLAQPAADLPRRDRRILLEQRPYRRPDGGVHLRPADAPGGPVAGGGHRRLMGDPLHGAARDAHLLGDPPVADPGAEHSWTACGRAS